VLQCSNYRCHPRLNISCQYMQSGQSACMFRISHGFLRRKHRRYMAVINAYLEKCRLQCANFHKINTEEILVIIEIVYSLKSPRILRMVESPFVVCRVSFCLDQAIALTCHSFLQQPHHQEKTKCIPYHSSTLPYH
jgi:hypothetical protein